MSESGHQSRQAPAASPPLPRAAPCRPCQLCPARQGGTALPTGSQGHLRVPSWPWHHPFIKNDSTRPSSHRGEARLGPPGAGGEKSPRRALGLRGAGSPGPCSSKPGGRKVPAPPPRRTAQGGSRDTRSHAHTRAGHLAPPGAHCPHTLKFLPRPTLLPAYTLITTPTGAPAHLHTPPPAHCAPPARSPHTAALVLRAPSPAPL